MAAEIVTHTTPLIESKIIGNRIIANPQDLATVAQRVSGDALPSDGQVDIIIADEPENGVLWPIFLDETTRGKPVAAGYFLRRGQRNPIVALVHRPEGQLKLEERQLTQAVADHYAARRYFARTRNVGRAALYGGALSFVTGIVSLATEHYTVTNASTAGVAAAVGMAAWFGERRSRINRGRTPRFKDIESIKECRPLRIIPDKRP
jgi:hypothetical protein